MGADSKIEWTHHTFNPWRGCVKVHEGCAHCYAETQSKRNPGTLGIWGANGTRVVASEAMWRQPLQWNAQAAADGVRARVFCASLADVFEDWDGQLVDSHGNLAWIDEQGIPAWQALGQSDESFFDAEFKPMRLDDVRLRLFQLIDATPNLDWLLLTKRPENIPYMWTYSPHGPPHQATVRPNVWLGTSVSLQEHADRQVPKLLKCRDLAARLFLSIEPLLGPIDLTKLRNGGFETYDALRAVVTTPHTSTKGGRHSRHSFKTSDTSPLDWVIVGGESGANARPMHPDWARSLRDQCQAAGVPFFFKQWGEWAPVSAATMIALGDKLGRVGPDAAAVARIGKQAAGRVLDGREWSEFPPAGVGETI